MRLNITIVLVVVVLALLTAGNAMAQTRKFEINLGGGFAPTLGDVENHFGDGWQFEAGFTYLPKKEVGIQAQYAYTKVDGRTFMFPVAPTSGGATFDQPFSSHMHVNSVSADIMIRPAFKEGLYFVAGPGIYARTVSLTTPSLGFMSICNPFFLICYPSAVSVETVLGDRTSTDFGINAGGGFAFKVSDNARLYVEARYVHVWGPEFTGPTNQTTNSNAQFLPISFGIRW